MGSEIRQKLYHNNLMYPTLLWYNAEFVINLPPYLPLFSFKSTQKL